MSSAHIEEKLWPRHTATINAARTVKAAPAKEIHSIQKGSKRQWVRGNEACLDRENSGKELKEPKEPKKGISRSRSAENDICRNGSWR